jgi:DNA-binding XRE family transcriptional regulator
VTLSPEIETILSKPTITVSEMAKIFGLSRNSAYAAVKNGDFETISVGKRILVLTIPLRRKLELDAETETALIIEANTLRKSQNESVELANAAAKYFEAGHSILEGIEVVRHAMSRTFDRLKHEATRVSVFHETFEKEKS